MHVQILASEIFIRRALVFGRTVKFHGIFAVKFYASEICLNGISASGVKFGGIFRNEISIRRILRGGLLAAVILRSGILRGKFFFSKILCGGILCGAYLAHALFAEVHAASRPGDHLFVHAAVGLDEGVFAEAKFINSPVHTKLIREA